MKDLMNEFISELKSMGFDPDSKVTITAMIALQRALKGFEPNEKSFLELKQKVETLEKDTKSIKILATKLTQTTTNNCTCKNYIT